jgi:hypothetical protein
LLSLYRFGSLPHGEKVNKRAANEEMKGLYGPGIGDVLQNIQRQDNLASLPTQDESEYPEMTLRHRKRSAILKEILKEGGFGDLAKEVSIRGR